MKIYITIDHLGHITAYTDDTSAIDLDILVNYEDRLTDLWLKYDPSVVGERFREWQIKRGQTTLPGME